MNKCVYAIHDDKVGTFGQPVLGDNDPAMVRSFGDLVNADDKSLYSVHKEDFSLWFLGYWDPEKGLFLQDPKAMRKLASGSDFLKEVK